MEDANRNELPGVFLWNATWEPESHWGGIGRVPSDGEQITGALEERCPGALSWVAKLAAHPLPEQWSFVVPTTVMLHISAIMYGTSAIYSCLSSSLLCFTHWLCETSAAEDQAQIQKMFYKAWQINLLLSFTKMTLWKVIFQHLSPLELDAAMQSVGSLLMQWTEFSSHTWGWSLRCFCLVIAW